MKTEIPPSATTKVLVALAVGAALGLALGACAAGTGSRAATPATRPPLVVQRVPLAPPSAEGVLAENDEPRVERAGRTTRLLLAPLAPVAEPELAADRAEARARSLALRAERRAYEGAPPVMPHPETLGGGAQGCLDCHGEGFELDGLVARPMSHAALVGCTQCHVEAASSALAAAPAPADNAFRARSSPGPGARAAPGAPPTIPHALAMRGRCLACHGELGWEGLRTDHPWRVSCLQCHVSVAGADRLSAASTPASSPQR